METAAPYELNDDEQLFRACEHGPTPPRVILDHRKPPGDACRYTQDHKMLNGRVAAIVDLLWPGVIAIVDV